MFEKEDSVEKVIAIPKEKLYLSDGKQFKNFLPFFMDFVQFCPLLGQFNKILYQYTGTSKYIMHVLGTFIIMHVLGTFIHISRKKSKAELKNQAEDPKTKHQDYDFDLRAVTKNCFSVRRLYIWDAENVNASFPP